MNIPKLDSQFKAFNVSFLIRSPKDDLLALAKEIGDGFIFKSLGTDRYFTLSHSLPQPKGGAQYLSVNFNSGYMSKFIDIPEDKSTSSSDLLGGLVGCVGWVSVELGMKFPKSALPSSGFVLSLYGLSHKFKDSSLNLNGASFDISGPDNEKFSWRESVGGEFEAEVITEHRSLDIDDETLEYCFSHAERQLRLFSFNESNPEGQ